MFSDYKRRFLAGILGEEAFFRLRMRAQLWRVRLNKRPVLFLHQMGKVGSSTIYRSLQKMESGSDFYLARSHFLSANGIAFFEQLEENGYGGWPHYPEAVKGMLARDYVLGQSVRNGDFRRRGCRVVTLVRDPVAVNVAGFFQNNDWWPGDLRERCRKNEADCTQALFGQFMENYPHQVPLTWFDEEIKNVFEIDVFATPFAHERGYTVYKNDWVKLLVLKLEKLDDCATDAFAEFLGTADFHLIRDNQARDKWYAPVYRRFKETAVFPETYFQQMYDSTYARHFYTDAEIDDFKLKWKSSVPAA